MKTNRMPVLFIGHGSPMNAIEDNEFNRTWRMIGASLPRPKAILSISAHWETRGTFVTGDSKPRTIHDFMGFPQELLDLEYPASGSDWLVELVKQTVTNSDVCVDRRWGWGLDHGTWSVLHPMYPQADIPVVQFSLDQTRKLNFHYALGQELRPLREEGVLILGSGNMVHNLRTAAPDDSAFDWALEYDSKLKDWILKKDHESIIHYDKQGQAAALSVNSAEHYIPLIYVLGASEKDEPIQFFCERVTAGSISMRCVQIG
ncbi:MAG: extradiol ring-cleavage dioxygenase class III protein subunit B [Chloroflexi bacterium]|nr:MAG: extradiol ring-cleavage dioxygenase class III protein subunit B [Chloroflexota bacterium]MBA4374841.1 4,5-DOPA dioxygenase extradiol [Anaerolinea sp.]